MFVEKMILRNREDVTLTSYILDDSKEILKGKKRPGMIICPGGANLFCSDREAEAVALRYAGMGYHAFVLRYSVYQQGKFDRNATFEVDPNSVFPNPMLDIAAAMLYIRDHNEKWLVDMDKVGICGFSAGGHNALMYSVYWDKDIITSYFNRPASDFKPAVAVVGYGYGDYVAMRKGGKLCTPNNPIDISLFGTSFPTLEQMESASPCRMVSENTPPMFLWCTSQDELVPSEQTLIMGLALARQGIDYEIHVFEKGKHGYSLADQSTASHAYQISESVAKWTDLVKPWLYDHIPVNDLED